MVVWVALACSRAPGPPAGPGGAPSEPGPYDSSAPEPPPTDSATTTGCDEPGCIVAVVDYGAWDRAAIEPYLYDGVTIDNGYAISAVEYVTEGGTATATVLLPIDPKEGSAPPPYPVVVNAHGTIGVDDPCQLSGTYSGTGLAALFGARGAIGVAPDYPGLGTPGYHRYLDARSEATSVLDAVRAAQRFAESRGVPTSGRSALVGLSQGGHAVLSAAALHADYAPELDIRAFAASGPASGYEEQWRIGVGYDGPHQALHALLAWSFAEVEGEDDAPLWAAGIADTVESHLTTRCGWSPDFGPEPTLYDDFPQTATEVFSAEYLAEYTTGEWDRFAWVRDRFTADRVTPWGEQTAPIAIWQGTDDATVPAWATSALVDDLRAGGLDVELHLVEGGEHTNTAFGFLAWPELATDESVAWVQERLAEP